MKTKHMRFYSILYISGLMTLLFAFVACNDDNEVNIIGTWELTGYDAKVNADNSETKTDVENIINTKYLFPSKSAIYILDESGNITIYPNGIENQSYSGRYTYIDGKLNISLTFGGGLDYHNLKVNMSDNTMSVDEDLTATFSNIYPTLTQAIRTHNLVRR